MGLVRSDFLVRGSLWVWGIGLIATQIKGRLGFKRNAHSILIHVYRGELTRVGWRARLSLFFFFFFIFIFFCMVIPRSIP